MTLGEWAVMIGVVLLVGFAFKALMMPDRSRFWHRPQPFNHEHASMLGEEAHRSDRPPY